jgi:uncharacterized protein with HEPN domain
LTFARSEAASWRPSEWVEATSSTTILESIAAIHEYTTNLSEGFLADQKTQDAVVRRLEIYRGSRPAMRNIFIHEYFGVDPKLLPSDKRPLH